MKNKDLPAIITLIIAFLCAVQSVFAENSAEPPELFMESVKINTDERVLNILCNTNAAKPTANNFKATLGNTELPVLRVTPFKDADEGTSYIFLADVSGSIRPAQLAAIKDTVTALCGKLTEKDNISIFSIGNEVYTQPFVSAYGDIQAQIDAIEPKHENTSIYGSVFKSLSILNTNENCRDKKALVIFSDGEEYSFDGITQEEVSAKIKESHIPIYTVALLGKNPAPAYVETAKILGSFARLSAGGRHYIHTLEKEKSKEIAEDVSDSVHGGLVVSLDMTGFVSDGGDMMLRLELTAEGMGTVSDGYAIPTVGMNFRTEDATAAEEPASVTTTFSAAETEEEPERVPSAPVKEKASFSKYLLIAIIAAAVIVVVVVLIIALRRKPPEPEPIPEPAPPAPLPAPPPAPLSVPPPKPVLSVKPSAPPPGKPRIVLRLTKIGHLAKQVYRKEFSGTLVIGRDAGKADLVFKDDDLLSGRHCSISYEQDGLILRDLGSTNKTFVNGVPVNGRYILEEDDILLIGSMELRVNWDKV